MILLLTPLKAEHEALCAALGGSPRRRDCDGIEALVHGEGLTTAVGGHGKVQFALTTSFLSERVSPRLVVCAGACGSLAGEVGVLDVVVATETLEHDFNLRFVKRPLPAFAGDAAALARLNSAGPFADFGVHFGRVASGDEDVMESLRGDAIRAATGALAVAWEGAGGARAARFQELPFLELRGVTDRAGAAAVAEFTRHLPLAMANVAAVLRRLL
jgi:adenosylhomocysteine nucleosidase